MSEAKRGCGFRTIGGLYLVSDSGKRLACDGLPLALIECGCCGFTPKFNRGFQWINPRYVKDLSNKQHKNFAGLGSVKVCRCPAKPVCPVCNADGVGSPEQYGLMFVGKNGYTPTSFIHESVKMGVSKRISQIPKDLVLGETWVFVAHKKVPVGSTLDQLKKNGLVSKEPEYEQAIFYGFVPERIEMPMWKGSLSSDEILALEARGITPVFIEDTPANRSKHKVARVPKTHLLSFTKRKNEKGKKK